MASIIRVMIMLYIFGICAAVLGVHPLEVQHHTSSRGPWIVHLNPLHTHEFFENSLQEHQRSIFPFKISEAFITHRFRKLLHGLVVNGITREELLELGAVRVVPDMKKRITETVAVPWGLDRIDQQKKPLDGAYLPAYDGNGVNVYVVDTGIDTSHIEFSNLEHREVKNIYNAYGSVLADIDKQGHGTHVSATIGGKTVGVSPNVNLYGCKVLADTGEGDSSDVLAALEMILSTYEAANRPPSVVSMSLGGPCDSDDCQQDTIVQAVEDLSNAGIVVSIASGNEGCNGCYGSPAASHSAISTGAFGKTDKVSFFSNFGPCVDVYAPGEEVLSACAAAVCKDNKSYRILSGTSMACPHVTGVIAQLLHKNPTATPHDVYLSLSCEAARDQLIFDHRDTVSRDLLLQVPKQDSQFICDLGSNCPSACSGQGLCLPSHQDVPGNDSRDDLCHCDPGRYGSSCEFSRDPVCSSLSSTTVTIDMIDANSGGWSFANFAILDSKGLTVDNAFDGLCFGSEGSKSYCLEDGLYTMQVSKGMFPYDVEWAMCDVIGGSPYTSQFKIDAGDCAFQCRGGRPTEIHMFDTVGDGWNKGYYTIFSPTGSVLYGGSLATGQEGSHNLCLPIGCSTLIMTGGGALAKQIEFDICGYHGHGAEVLSLCVNATLGCTATPPAADPSCATNAIPFSMFDTGDNGWEGGQMTLRNSSSKAVVDSSTLADGFSGEHGLCLADGCYDFEMTSGGDPKQVFWYACGVKGTVPWSARLCVDKAYGLCYGLTRCPLLLSRGHRSAHQHYFVTQTANGTDALPQLVDASNLHGVHELCELRDGCFDILLGTGKAAYSGIANEFELCGQVGHLPASARICTSRNGTSCEVKRLQQLVCDDRSEVLQSMVMYDEFGDGWGQGMSYVIRKEGDTKTFAEGSLAVGEYAVDNLCLPVGCYTITLPDSWTSSDVAWFMCGLLGGAPIDAARFCVEADGSCLFIDASDDEYTSTQDDDFPAQRTGPPVVARSKRPTAQPVSRVPTLVQPRTARPTTMPRTRLPTSDSAPPVRTVTRRPTKAKSGAPSCSPTSVHATVPPSLLPTIVPYSTSPSLSPSDTPDAATSTVTMLVVSFNMSVRTQLSTGDVQLMATDFTFVADACRHVLEVAGSFPWTVLVTNSRLIPESSRRRLLWDKIRSLQDDTPEGPLDSLPSAVTDAWLRVEKDRRNLLFGPNKEFLATYGLTIQVAVPLGNTRPFSLKEQVDLTLVAAKSDGALLKAMLRALAVRAAAEKDGSKDVVTASIAALSFSEDTSVTPVDVMKPADGRPDDLYDVMWGKQDVKSSLSAGAIAGIVIAVLVVCLCCGGVVYLRLKRARELAQFDDFRDDNVQMSSIALPPSTPADTSVIATIMNMSTRGISASTRGLPPTNNPMFESAPEAKFVILEDHDEADNPMDTEGDVDVENYTSPAAREPASGFEVDEVEDDEKKLRNL